MRLGFRRTPFDLIVGIIVALLLLPFAVAGIGGPFRYLLALVLVFLVPGYMIAAALFPSDGELEWTRRLALGAGLSVASVALLGLLLDLTPWGLNVGTVVGALVVLSIGASLLAWERRLRVPPERRLSLAIEVSFPRWRDFRTLDRLLVIGVALAIVSGAGVVAFGLAHPPAPDRYTEFYLLDPNGGLANYTLGLNTTQSGSVIVGIHNVEGRSINYTVVVRLVGLETVYNATTGRNETVEANSTFLDSFSVDVTSGARSQSPYAFAIPVPGTYLVEFRLFLGSPQGSPYRFVSLHVQVS